MLDAFQGWTVTLSGGFALYGITSMLLATICTLYGMARLIINLLED